MRHALARLVAAVGLLLAASVAHAVDLRLEPDTTQIGEGQTFGVSVVVRGGRVRGTPQLQAPPQLQVTYLESGQTTSVVNGRVDRYVRFRFSVRATEAGLFTLGPAIVVADDPAGNGRTRSEASAQVEIVVTPPVTSAAVGDDPLIAEVAFDREQAWQGQIVVLRQTFRSRVALAAAEWSQLPDRDLLVPKDTRPERREYVVTDARGEQLVQEILEPRLVTAAGDLRWDPPLLSADVVLGERGGLFGSLFQRTRRDVVQADPLVLDSRPLPPPPPGFSGLVGDFSIDSRLERTRAAVGASVAWRVRLDGDGTVEGFRLPTPTGLDGLKVYEGPARASAAILQGRYRSQVLFERELVPTRTGELEVPVIDLVVFSPTRGDYVTVSTPPATIAVRGGEPVDVEITSFADEPPLVEDSPTEERTARPLWRTGPAARLPLLEALPWALAAALAPGLVTGLLAAGAAVRTAIASRRAAEAREATAVERLEALPADPDQRLAALDGLLRLALARRLGRDPGTLDGDAAEALPDDLADAWRHARGELDRARFAGVATAPDLENRVTRLIRALEAP